MFLTYFLIFICIFRRSEFLGCISFPLKSIRMKEVNGTFKLQSRSSLTIPTPSITMTESDQQQQQSTSDDPSMAQVLIFLHDYNNIFQ